MGKFRNGELPDGSIGLSVDFRDFVPITKPPLGRTLSWSGGKRDIRADAVEQRIDGFGAKTHAYFGVSGVPIYKETSDYLVSPKARSRNAAIPGAQF